VGAGNEGQKVASEKTVPDWFHLDPRRQVPDEKLDTNPNPTTTPPTTGNGNRQGTFPEVVHHTDGVLVELDGRGKTAPNPGGTPPVPTATLGSHTIVEFDTLEDIAVARLGSRRYVKDLLALNPGVDPLRLKIGDKLVLPARGSGSGSNAPLPAGSSPVAWPKQHKVANGDTLWSIAMQYYGTDRHLSDLASANNIRDPRRLSIGAVLNIPRR
jgi:nucleoid-associated protein YgaU